MVQIKEQLTAADRPALEAVKGVGAVLADAFVSYFENENNRALFEKLLKELDIEKEIIILKMQMLLKVKFCYNRFTKSF